MTHAPPLQRFLDLALCFAFIGIALLCMPVALVVWAFGKMAGALLPDPGTP